ncbi:MAG TPA: hypothetical protein VMI93_11180, partial [Candidatus Solibacter sp.]|nr:hypothetical protein [Candidatus Solibacter sp.]
RLVRCGATHPTAFLRGQGERLETMLMVGTLNVHIKQNARVSRLRVFRFGAPPAAPAAGGGNGKKKAATKKTARR